MENTNENNDDVVCVSGYFDPIHVGHIEYFKFSKKNWKEIIGYC